MFARLTERNRRNLNARVSTGAVTRVLNSQVAGIGERTLSTPDGHCDVPADVVFIFAGGELPFVYLDRAGVRMQHPRVEPQEQIAVRGDAA